MRIKATNLDVKYEKVDIPTSAYEKLKQRHPLISHALQHRELIVERQKNEGRWPRTQSLHW